MPHLDGWTEPDIIINGYGLTFAEAMAVRVAVSSFHLALTDDAYRTALGESLADGYVRQLKGVERAMFERGK